MTAPSNPREALEPFARAAHNYADCADDDKFIDDDATVTVGNLREARAALATLSWPDGEKREAIARITADPGDGTVRPDLAHVLARGFHAMGWSNPQAAADDMIDAIASGLVQDEEAAWKAYQDTPIDLLADSDEETKRCVVNALTASPGEQKPVAWRYRAADRAVKRAWVYVDKPPQGDGWQVEPLYTSPPPAAGWDEAIVAVKPLAWSQKPPPGHEHEPFVYWSAGVGGHYRAERGGMLWMAHDAFVWEQHPTQKAAKEAAQADYEKAILAALDGGAGE